MYIQHNMLSYFANQQLGINSTNKSKSMQRLGSGYRINQASDDAAGLVISEKMRGQIRGLNQADSNIQDGVSLLKTADGALSEVHDILQRMGEISVSSATDTYTDEDRESMDNEFFALKKEINRISRQTEFNEQKILFDDTVSASWNPDDIQIYTSDSGDYNGIVYMGVRYDWSKFLSGDGGSSLDVAEPKEGNYYLDTVGGTRLHFEMDKGMDLPNISKKYDINADESAIHIDDFTYDWNKVEDEDGNPIDVTNPKEGLYTLYHYGAQIEFYVNDGDSLSDIIDQLDESGAGIKTSYESQVNFIDTQKAVYNLHRVKSVIDIDSTNKNNIQEPSYTIHADTDGIQVGTNTKVSWDNLTFTPPYYNGETTGVDFATGKGIGEGLGVETLVNFKCPDTGIEFAFTIRSEASLNEAIAGLDNVTIPTTIDAPMQAQLSLDASGTPVMTGASIINSTGLNISYETQRDGMALDFDTDSFVAANSLSGFNIAYAGTSFDLDSTELTKMDNFFRNGSSNTLQLTFKNGSSDSITINFNRANNATDISRPVDPDALNSYVTGLIDDFKTQFSSSSLSIKSDNAIMHEGIMSENSLVSGNATSSFVFNVKPKEEEPINIQAGANEKQTIAMYIGKISTTKLGIVGNKSNDRASKEANIGIIHQAIEIVSKQRAKIGAYENRLEHALNIADNTAENLQNAESKIRDADMADEVVNLTKNSMLEKVSQSILAQANQSTQGLLTLLQ